MSNFLQIKRHPHQLKSYANAFFMLAYLHLIRNSLIDRSSGYCYRLSHNEDFSEQTGCNLYAIIVTLTAPHTAISAMQELMK